MSGNYSPIASHIQQLKDLFNDKYSFQTGVKVERRDDSPLSGLGAQNPVRQELFEKFSSVRKVHFASKQAFLNQISSTRLKISSNSNVSGGMKIKNKHIGFSLAPVKDYKATIPTQNGSAFTLTNRYFRNSLFNGSSYDQEGKTVTIKDACSSCWDRTDHEIPSWRVTETEKGKSIFYAGRPDTQERAKIQGVDIFLNEIRTGQSKGFNPLENGTIEVHYVVNSLTNPTEGLSKWRKKLGAGQSLDERKSLKWERDSLKALRDSNKPIDVTYNGQNYQILLRPMHTHHTVSCMGTYNTLGDKGRKLENTINTDTYSQLKKLFFQRKGTFSKQIETIGDEIVQRLGDGKNSTSLPVHIRLAMVDMLGKILEVPIVHHCKSVVDRTSGGGAVSVANQIVYEDLLNDNPKFSGTFEQIIASETYKDLFLKGLQSQYSVSGDLRSAVDPNGELNTKRVLPGFMWHSLPEVQAHGFIPLIPEAGLKNFSMIRKVANYFMQWIFCILQSTIFLVPTLWLGLPIIKPTWIKLDKVLDLESDLLSEGGTRPLLEGPANESVKKLLKKGADEGKQLLKGKALPLIDQLSNKAREALFPNETNVRTE